MKLIEKINLLKIFLIKNIKENYNHYLGISIIIILSLQLYLIIQNHPNDETIIIENIQKTENDLQILEKVEIEVKNRIEKKRKENICFKKQLERKIEKLEYSIDYCSDEDNLEQFSDLN